MDLRVHKRCWIKKQDCCEYNCVLVFLAVFLVTLPGTYARFLAVTWGKPVLVVFQSCIGLAFFLAFWPVEFGVLSSHEFLPVFWSPILIFGLFVVFSLWFWGALRRV